MIGFLKLTPLILATAAAAKYDVGPKTSKFKNRPRAEDGVTLHWLDGSTPPTTPVGSTWGVPWSQGEINKTASISARTASGKDIAVQTWPLAYWPDGTLKWTGHALAADGLTEESVTIALGEPAEPEMPVSVSRSASDITVKTGSFTAVFSTSGNQFIRSLAIDGATKAEHAQLVVHIQEGPDPEPGESAPTVHTLYGTIDSATVEQDGPVRAVIKFTGKYSGKGHDSFLPFTARAYISAGATALRLVHFFIYDGNQNSDFIKGLGLTLSAPLSDALYDRHVRFPTVGGGLFGEAILGLSGLRRDATAAVLGPQFNGTPVPDPSTWPTTVSSEYEDLALWADWRLDQLDADRFTVQKRTDKGKKVVWLNAAQGKRASGVGYVGGAKNGGVGWGLREAWQRASTGADITGSAGDEATVSVWAHSPRAPALDMRSYDTVAHGLDLTYEDVGDPDPDPTGVGRSYDLTLHVFNSTPSRSDISQLGEVNDKVPLLVASPSFYASHKLFGGRWDLPNPSLSSGVATIEKAKSDLLDFYVAEVDQRKWYGFWDYGDVMHTYDQTRHAWRYDVGGYAWDNGELGTDLWLWMSFLRTGRADVFRLASAMTRHLSEVDFHHTGPYAGLGSRHHVTHWGDGAKEARITGATLRRPFYYLTADELTGDLMELTLQADQSIVTWEPLRKVTGLPPFSTPGRVRIGPDWTALAGNWFTHWERTGNETWLERIKVGMNDIGTFQYGLFQGDTGAVGWDPATAHLTALDGSGLGSYHLTMIFGGGEFLMELMDFIADDMPTFDTKWVEFCQYFNAPAADIIAKYGSNINSHSSGFGQLYAKLQAYAGERLKNDSLKQAAWDVLNKNTVGVWPPVSLVNGTDVPEPVNEIENLATNDAASLSLSQYAVLAIAPEFAPN